MLEFLQPLLFIQRRYRKKTRGHTHKQTHIYIYINNIYNIYIIFNIYICPICQPLSNVTPCHTMSKLSSNSTRAFSMRSLFWDSCDHSGGILVAWQGFSQQKAAVQVGSIFMIRLNYQFNQDTSSNNFPACFCLLIRIIYHALVGIYNDANQQMKCVNHNFHRFVNYQKATNDDVNDYSQDFNSGHIQRIKALIPLCGGSGLI